MLDKHNKHHEELEVFRKQILCFKSSKIRAEIFWTLCMENIEMSVKEIQEKLKNRKLESGTEMSNIRRNMRQLIAHDLIVESYSGHPKRYRIGRLGVCSVIDNVKEQISVRPLRGSSRFRDRWPKWQTKLGENILAGFIEKYAKSTENVSEHVCKLVDSWIRKLNLREINWGTVFELMDEALYLIDQNLGYRFRVIGATPSYWQRYSRIEDALGVHKQPYEKRILMDLNLQTLPDYILTHFTEGRLYGHGLTYLFKPFSISVDLRAFFLNGIKIPQYPANPPKHYDSALAFCRKIPTLCGLQSSGSVIVNNLNTTLAPYLESLYNNEDELQQWLQNLICDAYELYAIRPKDPYTQGLCWITGIVRSTRYM